MRNAHCRNWNKARNLKNVENETQTLFDLEYVEKHSKTWKMRNTHCRPYSSIYSDCVFSVSLPISRSYCVSFSFFSFSSYIAIFQVLQCTFLILHLFQCFSSCTRSNSVCVSFSVFFSFLAIFQVLQCALIIFHVFE